MKFIFIYFLIIALTSHACLKSVCISLSSIDEETLQEENDDRNHPNDLQIIGDEAGSLSAKIQRSYIHPHHSYFVYTLDILGPHHSSLPPPQIA